MFTVQEHTYSSDCLRYAYRCCDTKDLPEHIEQDPLLGYLQQGLIALDEARFANEINYFGHDAVPFEATPANDEEDPRKECSRYQIQDDQDRSCHTSDDGEAHEKM